MSDHEDAKKTFDALVTGELTHHAIWLEDAVDGIISDYFVGRNDKAGEFTRLFLRRDGLTFQDKLEIARGLIPLFGTESEVVDLKSILNRVEEFKSLRNAMAHGRNIPNDDPGLRLQIEIVTRSGKERVLEITPESHQRIKDEARELRKKLMDARGHLWEALSHR